MLLFIWMMWLAQDDEPFYLHYERGEAALKQERYAEAIAHLEAAVAKQPASKKQAKTYGVQFITYYPHHQLAQAYLMTNQPKKARESLLMAYLYEEDKDEITAMAMKMTDAFITNLSANYQKEPTSQDPDISPVWDALRKQEFEQAKNLLKEFRKKYPANPNLAEMTRFIDEMAALKNSREEAPDPQAALKEKINHMLLQGRNKETAGKLNEALPFFVAVNQLEPENLEAKWAVSRLQTKMEAQGQSRAEIQKELERVVEEQRQQQTQVSKLERNVEKLEKERDFFASAYKKSEGTPPPEPPLELEAQWDVTPTQNEVFTATVKASIQGKMDLEHVTLFINQKSIDSWTIDGTSFQIPVIPDFKFQQPKNELSLLVRDRLGRTKRLPYPYRFPQPVRPIGPGARKLLAVFMAAIVLLMFFAKTRQARMAFRNRFNPYIAGAPVLNYNMFYGRRPLLKQIMNTLHNNSIMIYGERRIGKTSFLHQLHELLPKLEDPHFQFVPVFIDLQGVKESHFFATMEQDIALALEAKGIRLEETSQPIDARQFTKRIRLYINHLKETCEKIPKLVLLLDEVDIMNGFSEQTNQQLRSVFMKGFAKHLVAVMAGININTTWKSEGSPWYNFFEQIELKPFSIEQAKSLIKKPVKDVYHFQKDAVNRIIQVTQGKPYLIQKICVNLIAHVLNENRRKITEKDVNSVFSEIKSEVFSAP